MDRTAHSTPSHFQQDEVGVGSRQGLEGPSEPLTWLGDLETPLIPREAWPGAPTLSCPWGTQVMLVNSGTAGLC